MKRGPVDALINVTQLLREPIGSAECHDIDGLIRDEVEAYVEGKAKLTHISRGILVRCEATAEATLVCSRCLDTFLCPIHFIAEEEFRSIEDVSGDSAAASAELTEEFTIDSKKALDLGELVRQYVVLNLPMKPLCRADCPGMKEGNSHATTAQEEDS
jgi:uncharacterized protein